MRTLNTFCTFLNPCANFSISVRLLFRVPKGADLRDDVAVGLLPLAVQIRRLVDEFLLIGVSGRHALLLQLADGLRVHLVAELPLRDAALRHDLFENGLILLPQVGPGGGAHDEEDRGVGVLGNSQLVVDLGHVVGENDRGGVLLAVQRALLQGGVGVGPGHGGGVGAHLLPEGDVDLVLHGPDGQAGHVGHGVDGPDAVGQVPEAGLPDAVAVQLHAGELIQELLADVPQEHGVRLVCGGDQIGDVQGLELASPLFSVYGVTRAPSRPRVWVQVVTVFSQGYLAASLSSRSTPSPGLSLA